MLATSISSKCQNLYCHFLSAPPSDLNDLGFPTITRPRKDNCRFRDHITDSDIQNGNNRVKKRYDEQRAQKKMLATWNKHTVKKRSRAPLEPNPTNGKVQELKYRIVAHFEQQFSPDEEHVAFARINEQTLTSISTPFTEHLYHNAPLPSVMTSYFLSLIPKVASPFHLISIGPSPYWDTYTNSFQSPCQET
ncbi:hypothetical protein VNO77_04365 [Canavalia gladiata]|uniref:Uncharacterized protein n=1 Tax=Canavalia gladiata TaxID=3824 RepID=A0AAN9R4R1_CANGL